MQELYENARNYFEEGQKQANNGQLRASCDYYQKSLDDLSALKPSKMRDSLIARVYLARYQASKDFRGPLAQKDLRFGYSYAKTCKEPIVQAVAEEYWHEVLANRDKD